MFSKFQGKNFGGYKKLKESKLHKKNEDRIQEQADDSN